jgi:hypothetical protein
MLLSKNKPIFSPTQINDVNTYVTAIKTGNAAHSNTADITKNRIFEARFLCALHFQV